MKRVLAFVLAAVMVMSLGMTSMAATSPSAEKVKKKSEESSSSRKNEGGYSSSLIATAAAEGKTVSEYNNNFMQSLDGISGTDFMAVGQGGHVIINGAPTNTTFHLYKPGYNVVSQAKSLVPAGYKVFNVLKVQEPRAFNTATVNFYIPGITAGMDVKVYMLVNGQLVPVFVREIRLDHVVLDMTQYGTLVFTKGVAPAAVPMVAPVAAPVVAPAM